MNAIGTPAIRLAPTSIVRSFQISNKKHLLLTGSRGSGKSTLAGQLAGLLKKEGGGLPGITTFAVPGQAVILVENVTGFRTVIGSYEEPQSEKAGNGGCMRPVAAGLWRGAEALLRCLSASGTEWVSLDELGYVESGCAPFCNAVRSVFEKKRVLAVVRKAHTPFLDELRARQDVFVCDLDEPFLPLGFVIMASGFGRRFGGNKLLAKPGDQTLLQRALEQTENGFARRVVVTRYEEAAAICGERNVDCVVHAFPERNDTVRIGVEYLQRAFQGQEAQAGYLFCPADQPLLTRETVETLALAFSQKGERDAIFRLAFAGVDASPVLFGADYGEQLKNLPQKKGGSWLTKLYPGRVYRVEATSAWEMADVDTPEDLERIRTHIRKVRRISREYPQ